MVPPFPLIGMGIGLIGGIGKMFGRGKANRELRRLERMNPEYAANPEVAKRLALAKTMLTARTPGAMQVERNIYGSQANAAALAQKTATDASQLLAAGADIQGRTTEAFQNLGIQESQDWQRRYGNVVGAQEAQVAEQDKVFQDKMRRWQDMASIRGAIQQNRAANWGDISNLGFGLANFGLQGGFQSMFGQQGGGQQRPQGQSNQQLQQQLQLLPMLLGG